VSLLGKEAEGRRRLLLLVCENRDHGSHFAKADEVVAGVGATNTIVHVLTFSPALSQVLDNARGANEDEWSKGTDLLAPILIARHAMKKNVAKAIADMTGGEYDRFASRKAFEEHLVDFTNRMYSRYMLSFEPHQPHPGLHRIRVRLRDQLKGENIAFRRTYWASDNAKSDDSAQE
jgi:hypothetical protein